MVSLAGEEARRQDERKPADKRLGLHHPIPFPSHYFMNSAQRPSLLGKVSPSMYKWAWWGSENWVICPRLHSTLMAQPWLPTSHSPTAFPPCSPLSPQWYYDERSPWFPSQDSKKCLVMEKELERQTGKVGGRPLSLSSVETSGTRELAVSSLATLVRTNPICCP